MRMVSIAELLFAAYLIIIFIVTVTAKLKPKWGTIFWLFQQTILAFMLCIALRRLRCLQKKISVILCDEKLMYTHGLVFISATAMNWLSSMLTIQFSVIVDDKEARQKSDQQLRQEIAGYFFWTSGLFLWVAVQLLILLVFIKYGKPIEDDARTMIENKLTAIYQKEQEDASNEEVLFKRRMEAYNEIADRQLSEIIRAMMSYCDNRASRRFTKIDIDTQSQRTRSQFQTFVGSEAVLLTESVSLGIQDVQEQSLSQVAIDFRDDYLGEQSDRDQSLKANEEDEQKEKRGAENEK